MWTMIPGDNYCGGFVRFYNDCRFVTVPIARGSKANARRSDGCDVSRTAKAARHHEDAKCGTEDAKCGTGASKLSSWVTSPMSPRNLIQPHSREGSCGSRSGAKERPLQSSHSAAADSQQHARGDKNHAASRWNGFLEQPSKPQPFQATSKWGSFCSATAASAGGDDDDDEFGTCID
jgi:hypothetical protein